MIKRIKILATGALLLAGLGACSPSGKKTGADSTVDTLRTAETVNLLNNLRKVPTQGIMFGHHDDPLYGVGWEGDEDRSDVKSVCGDYPAVMSFDLGHIELEREKSLDNVPFRKIRQETINQYKRGGVVSFSWHLDNPLTGKDAWDVSDTTVVRSFGIAGLGKKFLARCCCSLYEYFGDGRRYKNTGYFPSLARAYRQLVLVGTKSLHGRPV